MSHVISDDGTPIAYSRSGTGPAVLLVGGGLDDGSENMALVPDLARRFTVYNYARRGRGDSGDTAPYAVEREIEDLGALISEAGGSAHVFGVSSGGALALQAAAAGLAVDRMVVYEVPYMSNDTATRQWAAYVQSLVAALEDGRRTDAVASFMRLAGSSEEDIAAARVSSFWPNLETLAPTLAYDAACLGDGRPPLGQLMTITQPTLVATGGSSDPHMSGLQAGFFDEAADAIAAAIPGAQRLTVEGQAHVADAKALVPVLESFFTR